MMADISIPYPPHLSTTELTQIDALSKAKRSLLLLSTIIILPDAEFPMQTVN